MAVAFLASTVVSSFLATATARAADEPGRGLLLELVEESPRTIEADANLSESRVMGFRVTNAATEVPVFEGSATIGDAVDVALAPGRYRVSIASEGWWSADSRVELLESAEPVRVTMSLWPTGTVRGKVFAPEGELPRGVVFHARFEAHAPQAGESRSHRGLGAPAEGTTPCVVDEAFLVCRVPSGTLDLRLTAGELVPLDFWGLDVEPGELTPLGALRFRRGSSVSGTVLDRDTRAPVGQALVELAPTGATFDPDAENRERSRRRVLGTRTDARGLFRLVGVPEGAYEVWLSKDGYARTRMPLVRVGVADEHAFEEPLLLGRPTTLEILLTPPLDPYGEPWTIELHRFVRGRRYEVVGDVPTEAGLGGTWEARGLRPGPYLLIIGNGLDPRWHFERLEVGPEGHQVVPVELDFVAVEGTLSLGDRPLTATLWFGGRHGEESIRFDADRDGEFRGYLPREGEWKVELSRFGEPGVRVLEPVEVKRPSGSQAATLAIELPDTVLRGRVVDAEGRPQPGARLLAVDPARARRELMELADEQGEFELRGMEPGALSMQAESSEGTSPWVPVHVEEGRDSPEIVLRIARTRRVVGSVVSAGGPVAGATVKVVPSFTDQGPVRPETAVTKVDGSFELNLPEHVRRGTVVVFPPGFAAKIFDWSFGEGAGRLDLTVESEGGTLELGLASARAGAPKSGLLLHAGAVVGVEQLEEWSRLHGGGDGVPGRLLSPAFQGGYYQLCSRALLAPEGGGLPASCDGGILVPGGTLDLTIQSDEEAE